MLIKQIHNLYNLNLLKNKNLNTFLLNQKTKNYNLQNINSNKPIIINVNHIKTLKLNNNNHNNHNNHSILNLKSKYSIVRNRNANHNYQLIYLCSSPIYLLQKSNYSTTDSDASLGSYKKYAENKKKDFKTGIWERASLFFASSGFLVFILILIITIVLSNIFITRQNKKTAGFSASLKFIQENELAQKLLGTPIEDGYSVGISRNSDYLVLRFSVSGPLDSVNVRSICFFKEGRGSIVYLELTPKNGNPIVLLEAKNID
eukprot:TRINITY_DN2556_c2_g1_i1.p1 TRINITY_DN2556_c2_g1~~TRINITY_DN2556_c2_g1_i1.p1  ORF type:complete len:278 (+),score=69.17 TRINITY_DN2556_c2_g1_i1:57-836(+)